MKWKNYNEKSFVESEFESITIKITSQEWKEIRDSGKRRTPDGREYDAELAESGEIDGN